MMTDLNLGSTNFGACSSVNAFDTLSFFTTTGACSIPTSSRKAPTTKRVKRIGSK